MCLRIKLVARKTKQRDGRRQGKRDKRRERQRWRKRKVDCQSFEELDPGVVNSRSIFGLSLPRIFFFFLSSSKLGLSQLKFEDTVKYTNLKLNEFHKLACPFRGFQNIAKMSSYSKPNRKLI